MTKLNADRFNWHSFECGEDLENYTMCVVKDNKLFKANDSDDYFFYPTVIIDHVLFMDCSQKFTIEQGKYARVILVNVSNN